MQNLESDAASLTSNLKDVGDSADQAGKSAGEMGSVGTGLAIKYAEERGVKVEERRLPPDVFAKVMMP